MYGKTRMLQQRGSSTVRTFFLLTTLLDRTATTNHCVVNFYRHARPGYLARGIRVFNVGLPAVVLLKVGYSGRWRAARMSNGYTVSERISLGVKCGASPK